MATLSKIMLVVNTALVYLITLSWPESLFWSDVLASVYHAFSTSYVFDLAFGGLGIVAFLGLTRPMALQFLNTVTGRILEIAAAIVLLFVNLVGFAITPYTTISFSKINLTGFNDAGLLARWVRASSDVAEPTAESERSELFAYAFFRELKRNNFSREHRGWYLGTLSLVELIRPFEICISQSTLDRCFRHKQASTEGNSPGWLVKIRNRHTELVLTGDVSIVSDAGGHVFRVSLQSDRTTWRGELPAIYLERTVDLPSEALSEVFRWLGIAAWNLLEVAKKRAEILVAKELAAMAVQISGRKRATILDTLAEAEFKLGRKKEAIEINQEALTVASEEGEQEVRHIKNQLQKFEASP